MPKPKRNEAKQDYLKRCTAQVTKAGEKPDKAFAQCNATWNQEHSVSQALKLSAPVKLEEGGDKKGRFLIVAKTSDPVQNMWGETIFLEIKGMRTEAKLPILRQHDPNSVVGFGSSFKQDNTLFIEREFSQVTETGKEVKDLAEEGYPWQASIGVYPEKVETLEDEKAVAKV
ncbi:MAG TPA: hypothetical protein ENI07_00520, partial [Desulfobacterales bacterium]|nr:hypothetical protein [Desulfobacterales bacterium]